MGEYRLMVYRLLADLLVGVHLTFVLFVVFGGALVVWRRWVFRIHLPAAAWGAFIELSGWVCPLTRLEVRFRLQGGEVGYTGGFVDHYLIPILYPPGLNREMQIWLGVAVVVINLGFYGAVIWKASRPRGSIGQE